MNLTDNQQIAIGEISHNLQIVACAGSGKTEVISRRIARILNDRKDVAPGNIVCFTFTNKAADSMKQRIGNAIKHESTADTDISDMYIGTIHSFCLFLLQNYTNRFRHIRVLDNVRRFHFITRYRKVIGMDKWNLSPSTYSVRLFSECISKMADDYANRDSWSEINKQVFDSYRAYLYKHGFIDFTFLILETILTIDSDNKLRDYLSTIKYLTVDEYQDIDDLQEQLIRKISDCGANICVVGDDDQTIYQFRGSNSDHMIGFANRYADVVQVHLDTNFRCSSKVVDIAETVIRKNTRRLEKRMASVNHDGISEIVATRYQSETDEFEKITDKIEALHDSGVEYNEIAVLFRKGKHVKTLGRILDERGIPYVADSAYSFFTGEYFQCFSRTMQIMTELDKAQFTECWQGIISEAYLSDGFKYIRKQMRNGSGYLYTIFSEFMNVIHFFDEGFDDLTTRKDDARGFLKMLVDYEDIYGDWQLTAKIDGILKFVGEHYAAEEYKYHSFREPASDAVNIMTIHKAKGLEFDTVFLPELQEGEFPPDNMGGKKYWQVLGGSFEKNKEKYSATLEDERKLFYVAVTRAKRNLFLSYELSKKRVSRFVKEAADSSCLAIDRNDFGVDYSAELDDVYDDDYDYTRSKPALGNKVTMRGRSDRQNDWRQDMEYRRQVREARHQVMDYYGTAAHFMRDAGADLMRASSMSEEEILEEAKRLHIY